MHIVIDKQKNKRVRGKNTTTVFLNFAKIIYASPDAQSRPVYSDKRFSNTLTEQIPLLAVANFISIHVFPRDPCWSPFYN